MTKEMARLPLMDCEKETPRRRGVPGGGENLVGKAVRA